MPKFSVAEIAPALFILLFLVFALLHQLKKKNAKSVEELKEQSPENWEKFIKRSAIVKLLGWCSLGAVWIGIVALNLSNLLAGNESIAILMSSLGVVFIAVGI